MDHWATETERTVSGDELTVVSAVAGIVVGFLTSWWFSWSSKRHAQAERAILVNKISTLQSILSGVAESIRTKPIITGVEVDHALHAARLPDEVAGDVVTSLRSAASASTTDVFVRASLGALLNERGEVSVPRLLQEVAHALPEASLSSVLSSLEELRKTGRVSWSGDDVRRAGVIRVHPQWPQPDVIAAMAGDGWVQRHG
jgi:hypothetical protein